MTVICRKMPTVVCRFKYFLIPQNHWAIEYSDAGAKIDLHRPTEIMPRSCKKKSTLQGIVKWSQNLSFKSKQMTQKLKQTENVKISTPLHSTLLMSFSTLFPPNRKQFLLRGEACCFTTQRVANLFWIYLQFYPICDSAMKTLDRL